MMGSDGKGIITFLLMGHTMPDEEVRGMKEWERPEERQAQGAQAPDPAPEGPGSPPPSQEGKAALAARQIDRWMAQMERLRLAEYVRYADDKRRVFWSHFWGGVARGLGMAVGFTILGAILVLILQNLAKRNLPVIGDALAQIVSIVQKRLE